MKRRVMQKTLAERQKQIDAQRAKAQEIAKKAFETEEISRANKAYIDASFSAMTSDEDMSKTVEKSRLEYQKTLKKYGFCEEDFESKPSCPLCNDTGYVDGKVCSCVWDLFIKNLKEECQIDRRAKFSFEDCDLSKIKNKEQRALTDELYQSMKKYVDKFPPAKCKTLVFSGGVGTGKTCLASAMARAIVEKGYAVKFVSAYEFCSLMLTVHTSPIAERNALLHDVIACDMLVIDDLGTEPMLKNVTVEYLLLVLEERQTRGRATVITTNLTGENILNRYGERIYSRLSHKQYSMMIEMKGNDLRL